MENVDLVVIGAGWHGLSTAKTALELNPSLNIVVLDSSASIGGVWAKERLYDSLHTNNIFGTYEFSDFPMREVVPALRTGQHIPAEYVHTYLVAYAERFNLKDRIRLCCTVQSIEYTAEKSWVLRCSDRMTGRDSQILTNKLIVATGLTSQPYMPDFKGQDTFGAPLLHVRDLAVQQDRLAPAGAPVTIVGGSKSAWDAVYACATTGRQVDWVIRENGNGPAWMTSNYVSPLGLSMVHLPLTRALTVLSPCPWASQEDGLGWLRRFLHGTWLGRKMIGAFWALLEWEIARANNYAGHEETKRLRPWTNAFWAGTSVGILNFPSDFFQVIRDGNVKVHIADVDNLQPKTVWLSNGESIHSEALIVCTGWKAGSDIQFLPEGIDQKLGFPWAPDVDEKLVSECRQEIINEFPTLGQQPLSRKPDSEKMHPFRLARLMVPAAMWEDRSIAFPGVLATFNTALITEVQALWACVYLKGGAIQEESNKSMMRESIYHSEFFSLLTPASNGGRYPEFVFPALPYVDMLLRDVGLQPRKKGSLWRNLFTPTEPAEYRGLAQEWKQLHAKDDSEDYDHLD